ncbi:putative nuclease HARBI1 isoform X3 [Cephus cinctus]|uniref:Nuclease HARBI1 isoform X3 n=1 Tax=Cephus cinctus TaxID=211228 RepID=A0AAJ7RKL7_CEPCN|nr:putative nuclease HARBI1 isoform X3 [Cephus cinctus]
MKLKFEFRAVASPKESETTVIAITSIVTEQGEKYAIPHKLIYADFHEELRKTEAFKKMVHEDLRWLSQASVSRIVKNVSMAFAEQLKQFICFPRSDTGIRRNTATFYTIAHFPSVVGCLDCTHIPISNPGGENAEVFQCRKGYFSLNVQVVCGPNMEIMDIVVRPIVQHTIA